MHFLHDPYPLCFAACCWCRDPSPALSAALSAPDLGIGSVVLVLDDPTAPPLMSLPCTTLANGDPCPAVAIVWRGRRDCSLMMPVR